MSYHSGDTICAIATAAGGAARGMVRVSGPEAVAIVARCFWADDGAGIDRVTRPTAVPGRVPLVLRTDGDVRDPSPAPRCKQRESMVPCDAFVWPTNRSYTREPVVELHTLGSPPILEAVLSAVCRAGARLAEPGEFTLRAFLSGRLDLTQAEAVLGVIDAHGEAELEAALEQLSGGLAGPLRRVRDELLQLLAELEAGLDFVEEDIEFVTAQRLSERLSAANALLDHVAAQMAMRHAASPSVQIALIGPPNAGKSSLFNALVARYGIVGALQPRASALVSAQRGTTRDYLTATISVDGLRCELVDTAGMEEEFHEAGSSPPLHQARQIAELDAAAQQMSMERRARALVRAHCIDIMQAADAKLLNLRGTDVANRRDSDVIVFTKSDLAARPFKIPADISSGMTTVVTSSRTGQGLAELSAAFQKLLGLEAAARRAEVTAATADRCRESIRLARDGIARAAKLVNRDSGEELVAMELRAAVDELGKVVGAVYTDDLLDRIFKSFCIGK